MAVSMQIHLGICLPKISKEMDDQQLMLHHGIPMIVTVHRILTEGFPLLFGALVVSQMGGSNLPRPHLVIFYLFIFFLFFFFRLPRISRKSSDTDTV